MPFAGDAGLRRFYAKRTKWKLRLPPPTPASAPSTATSPTRFLGNNLAGTEIARRGRAYIKMRSTNVAGGGGGGRGRQDYGGNGDDDYGRWR